MMVLICLIFSVLSTIEQYANFANETLFWMVSFCFYKLYAVSRVLMAQWLESKIKYAHNLREL